MISATKVSASGVGIDASAISDNALKVVQELQQAGYQAYLVGGCVRDLILGRKPKDFDVATSATPEQTKKLFRNARIIGRRFRIVHVRFGYEVIEVATFRANASDRDGVSAQEMTEGDQGQLLRDNVYGSIEEDVMRRDFRANALYYDPERDEILDFVGGIEDIEKRQLISIGDPQLRFREDPVRMLRVVRFAAKLDFSMEPQAKAMIEEEGKLLAHVSAARLFEEVLKLFHGGAAFDTYIMLREFGLFKYLFPFTDQGVIDDVIGMPERALKNTDKRIRAGKPVIPAFLFACMLWDPVKADADLLMRDGTPESQAWRVAMADALRDQNQYVAVPRRLGEIILDIWNIHFRLIKRNPRMIKASLSNRRFRAAYDFLLLRVALHEVSEDVGEWWTKIQEVDPAEREEMITELGEVYKEQRQAQHADGEANGNSVNYNGSYDGGVDTPKQGRANTAPRGKKKAYGGKKRSNKRNAHGQNRRRSATSTGGGRPRRAADSQPQGNHQGSGDNIGNSIYATTPKTGKAGKKRGKKRAGKRMNHANGRPARNDQPYREARPRDDYGTYQVASTSDEAGGKKVKVRKKRRVLGPDNEPKPHF